MYLESFLEGTGLRSRDDIWLNKQAPKPAEGTSILRGIVVHIKHCSGVFYCRPPDLRNPRVASGV